MQKRQKTAIGKKIAIRGAAIVVMGVSANGLVWSQQDQASTTTTRTTTRTTTTQTQVGSNGAAFLQQWPESSRTIAAAMLEKYGQPDEFTQDRLIWYHRRPFKRIVVRRFPTSHYDLLEETVNYMYSAEYEQGTFGTPRLVLDETVVMPDIGKYELTSISNSEKNNILALNLADDVLSGRLSPNQARAKYREANMYTLSGKTVPATESLRFVPEKPANSDWNDVVQMREGRGA